MCSRMTGQFLDTMIVASNGKKWLQQPIKISLPETVLSHHKGNTDPSYVIRSKDPKTSNIAVKFEVGSTPAKT